ncbi:MAG: AAA family ATPase [Candidatus Dojkabacteria bacterium]|jgi:nicotinamide riboside kinase
MKMAVCGTHCVGKTTIVNELKKMFPKFGYVSEIVRNCPFEVNEKTTFKSQEWILRHQIMSELEKSLDDITICDRSVFDQLAYVNYAYEGGTISQSEREVIRSMVTAWGDTYDFVFYIPIEFDNVMDDGFRSTDKIYRENIDKRVRNILMLNVPEYKMMTLTGTIEERMETIKNKLYDLVECRE